MTCDASSEAATGFFAGLSGRAFHFIPSSLFD
jgi:hypothetical protein